MFMNIYIHFTTLIFVHTNCKMIAPAFPTNANVVTGARALMANARAVAVTDNKAIVNMKKKNLYASDSKPINIVCQI